MTRRISLLAIGAVCGTATTTGQVDPLDPVEAVIADTGALSVSLRHVEAGLRQPVNFDQVYRVPGEKGLLMRVDGGLYAVFPQSVYVRDRHGVRPVIPNNTMFYIGEPALGADTPAPRQFVGRINTRIDPLPTGLADSRRPLSALQHFNRAATMQLPRKHSPRQEMSEAPTILSDEIYRRQRMRSLMRRAAQAKLNRGSSHR